MVSMRSIELSFRVFAIDITIIDELIHACRRKLSVSAPEVPRRRSDPTISRALHLAIVRHSANIQGV